MKACQVVLIMLLMACSSVGCRGKVEPTADSVKIEAEVPKVEIKKTPNLDPRTDDDVDIKTPAAGAK